MSRQYARIVLLLACAGVGSAAGSQVAAEPPARAVLDASVKGCCSEQTVGQCVARTDCSTIVGWVPEQSDAGLCINFGRQPVPMGCRSAVQECGEAITAAAPTQQPDRCIWFPTTCVPAGWRECDAGEVSECPSP